MPSISILRAIIGGYEQIVRLNLEHGVDVNTQGLRYDTALHAALVGRLEAIVRLLLKHGSKINTQDSRQELSVFTFLGGPLQSIPQPFHIQSGFLQLDLCRPHSKQPASLAASRSCTHFADSRDTHRLSKT